MRYMFRDSVFPTHEAALAVHAQEIVVCPPDRTPAEALVETEVVQVQRLGTGIICGAVVTPMLALRAVRAARTQIVEDELRRVAGGAMVFESAPTDPRFGAFRWRNLYGPSDAWSREIGGVPLRAAGHHLAGLRPGAGDRAAWLALRAAKGSLVARALLWLLRRPLGWTR